MVTANSAAPSPPRLTRAEAARLNGAKSRGPVTQEGKRRSARNAFKHGLTAESFALAPGEDGEAFQELQDRLAARYRPADELAAHLVQRLASVMWRQYRADRLEAEVLAQREQRHDPSYVAGYVPGSPLVWDAARFNAVQRQQARLDRMLFKLIDELARLAPAVADEAESEAEVRNEPDLPPGDANVQNEPKPAATPVAPPVPPPVVAPAAAFGPGQELPLPPELEALLDENTEEAFDRFVAGYGRLVEEQKRALLASATAQSQKVKEVNRHLRETLKEQGAAG
jgi:hypothetical protein